MVPLSTPCPEADKANAYHQAQNLSDPFQYRLAVRADGWKHATPGRTAQSAVTCRPAVRFETANLRPKGGAVNALLHWGRYG